MGRMIDVDALIEAIVNKTGSETVLFNTTEELNAYLTGCAYKQNQIIDMINDTPTAYDIEKVVAELEGEVEYQDKKADEADVFEEVSASSARISMRKCYEHAIEIVRKGSEST